ncbi:MAG: LysR substrate-binding domain-containing protein [Candidatus Poribacteria bacterium]|nr:LysR substrate-binding domain-containing protein [Candidatus Poribacteria bacterium]
MTISTKQLEVFLAVVECGTVTGAAERLCLSQPAVSRTLERFQHEAGFEIFRRKGNRLVVTDSGSAFYDEVKRYYSGLEKINQVARDLAADLTGSIRIGVFAGWSNGWITSHLEKHFSDRENIEISVETRDSRTLIDLVISRSLDFAITINNSSHAGVNSKVLCHDKGVCIVPPGHKLTARKVIHLEDFEGENIISCGKTDPIQIKISEYLEHAKNTNQRIRTTLASTACSLVANRMGVSIVPETFAQEYAHLGYSIRPLSVDITMPIYLITPRNRVSSNIVNRFIDELTALSD